MGSYGGLLASTGEQTSSQPRMKQIVVYTLANVIGAVQDHLKNQKPWYYKHFLFDRSS